MSWGYKITILYTGFALFMFGMVFACVKYNKIQLVAKDYYAQEVTYDLKAEKIRNTRALEKEVEINYEVESQKIRLNFPEMQGIEGKVTLYRPSNSNKDKDFEIRLDNFEQQIDISRLSRGQWKVLLEWKAGGKEYYQDKLLIL